jgi:two-component system, response regulator RegA
MPTNILIIDDDQLFAETLTQELNETENFRASYLTDPKQMTGRKAIDMQLVLIDLRLKHQSGLTVIEEAKFLWPNSQVYMMTGFGSIASAVTAMKLGATDYLTKPITIKKIENLLKENGPNTQDIGQSEPLSLDRVEREYIELVLAQEKGNISKAAEKLGLHRQSLQRKLKKWVPFK